MRRPLALAIVGIALALPLEVASSDREEAAPDPTGTSVVLIVTDDQRWDTLWAMPEVQRLLVDEGVTFANAVVSNPLCCPSRATILTGELSHSTGVYRVTPPFGGFGSFDDRSTVATWLDDAGYATGLFGKYLDAYQAAGLAGYVPPGWDRWVAPIRSGYTDLRLNVDGDVVDPPPDAYATDLLGTAAASFIRSTDGPLFVVYAPPAPHEPATPAPVDVGAFDGLPPWRPPSFDRVGTDAPAFMRDLAPVDAEAIDGSRRDQYRSLLAVDRQVGGLVDALAETGRLEDTLVIFTSDNGLLWGEHRWTRKEVPYEESIRVPLVIRWGPASADRIEPSLVANVDLAPTIAAVAGVAAPPMEGRSLDDLLRGEAEPVRDAIVLEHMEGTNPVPTYCGIRTADAKLVRYATGEEELYDLRRDPYELTNVATSDPRRAELAALLDAGCRPGPPGWDTDAGRAAAVAVVALALGLAGWSRRRSRTTIA